MFCGKIKKNSLIYSNKIVNETQIILATPTVIMF
jgi:hypothetical protein